MKRFCWLNIVIFFMVVISLLPLAFAGAAQAGTEKSRLEELITGADSIIVGTVAERFSYWNDEHTGIYTSVTLSVEDRLKGMAGQDRVTVTLPGGEVDEIGLWVSDMPSFDQGERAIVFLKKLSKAQLPKAKAAKFQLPEEQFEVYGGFEGKFTIKQDKVGNLPAAEFKERVSKVLKDQTLPDGELNIVPSPVTFPYSYAGFCWPHPPNPAVGYRINENTTDCTGEGAAAQAAAATWSAAGANFSFSYAGTTTATAYSYNGFNEILWKDFGGGGTIAHAIIWYSGSTILENDIEFNDYYAWSTSASCPGGYYDVQTIGLHELGHWLCLADLYDAADATKVMYGYGSTGTTKRTLHPDDTAGIQYIYGASPTTPTVTNASGATSVTATSATLNGNLTSDGGAATTVHIYWGTTDGGTNPASWGHDENLGTRSAGAFSTNISGLTNNTTYYYRCYATNSAGTSWAASSSSFVAQNINKLVGADDATITGTAGAEYLLLGRFTASSSSNISQFRIKCSGPGNVKVAIYSDSSGEPGALLNAVNISTPVTTGWNNIPFPTTSVTTSTPYWLAFNSNAYIVGYAGLTGTTRFKPATYATFTFPSSAGTGFSPSPANLLLAGWGASPTLDVTTTSLPNGTVGSPYSQTLQATGGAAPYTWAISSGSLPASLNLNTSIGLISGTPSSVGTSNFTAQVADSVAATDSQMATSAHLIHRLSSLQAVSLPIPGQYPQVLCQPASP